MRTRKQLLPTILILIFIGSLGLYRVSSNPRFEAYHNVDIIQLIASGVCFGVALTTLVALIRGSRST